MTLIDHIVDVCVENGPSFLAVLSRSKPSLPSTLAALISCLRYGVSCSFRKGTKHDFPPSCYEEAVCDEWALRAAGMCGHFCRPSSISYNRAYWLAESGLYFWQLKTSKICIALTFPLTLLLPLYSPAHRFAPPTLLSSPVVLSVMPRGPTA